MRLKHLLRLTVTKTLHMNVDATHIHTYILLLYTFIIFYLRINNYYDITNIFPQLPLISTLHFSCHDKNHTHFSSKTR